MISSFTFSISLSFFFIIRIFNTEAAPTYIYHNCPNTTLFTPNSTYRSNLNTLLSSLSSASTNSTNGFANDTAGQNPPDQAHGLFLCCGDLDNATCSDCVATGKQEILQRCPNQRVSVIWYDECMLRYSNQSNFSAMERSPFVTLYNTGNVTDTTQLMDVLLETMRDVTTRALAGWLGKKVAAAEANFTSLQKLYAFAQCTPDLTAWDCNACLQFGNGYVVQGKQGGRVLTPSCIVRYELYPFYNASALLVPVPPPPSPSPPPPLAPMTQPKGKSNKSTVIAIAIAVPIGGVMILLFLTCCLLGRKKTDKVVEQNSGANELTTVESLQFDLATIQAVTNDFSPENKLGEGGFGEVFQGRLLDGQQIAVKRLSQNSRQGDEEFKNEVLLVAKLQHRNLVRLLGFCLEGDEKLLAYKFVPNKSLDYFLFDFPELFLQVWNKWRDGTPLKVLDPSILDSYSRDEVLRYLHIGLLCIQEDPAIRPTMATVVLMLSNNYFNPPSPQHPAFFVRSRSGGLSIPMKELGLNPSTSRTLPSSTNDMSVTELYPQ